MPIDRNSPFVKAIIADRDNIGDKIRAAIPEGAVFALFVAGDDFEQAALIANIPPEDVSAIVGEWLAKKASERMRLDDGDPTGGCPNRE
jgi:hypothetical protein